MSVVPEPSTSRGDITLQPSYFTSSLYVNALREDLGTLIRLYSERLDDISPPFELFKRLWAEQGWSWLHMRVYDGRARQTFLRITERVFTENLVATETALTRIVALFCLYTFYTTQPSTTTPPILSLPNISIPIDIYEAMISLPSDIKEPKLLRVRPYAVHVLATMLDAQAFHILPHSSLRAQNPSVLPREIFVPEGQDPATALHGSEDLAVDGDVNTSRKKKGRPSKRDKIRRAKEAVTALEKYVDKNTVYLLDDSPSASSSIPSGIYNPGPQLESTHVILGQAPHTSLDSYLAKKNDLLATVWHNGADSSDTASAQAALRRANEAVLTRLKQIDAMAAENGLEVGGEGGEKTGLARVESAVDELRQCIGKGANAGILGLLEGAGMDAS